MSTIRERGMIELGLIDLSAEGRRRLAHMVERWTWSPSEMPIGSLPRISLHLLTPQELQFNGALDLCIIGPELLSADPACVGMLRKQCPHKAFICIVNSTSFSFTLLDQLGRFGVDDVLLDNASSQEFIRRLVLLKRRVASSQMGRLVLVDSARGGVGATFVTAALAEGWHALQRSVCVVDGDTFSQDLTRSLQVRPYVNEPLKLLLDGQRLVTSETVSECCFHVWADEPRIRCVPPPVGSDEVALGSVQSCRAFMSVVEVLQSRHDVVVIDVAPLVSGIRNALYQIADQIVFVLNRDPAGAFANRQALSLLSGYVRPEAIVTPLVNSVGRTEAPTSLIRDQIVPINGRGTPLIYLPYVPRASRWACSGSTPYRHARRYMQPILAGRLFAPGAELKPHEMSEWRLVRALRAAMRRFRSNRSAGRISAETPHSTPLLPFPPLALGFDQGNAEVALISRATLSS